MLFSESQTKAINHKTGPALVLAGPGSGKTSVIINRLKFLIKTENINPRNILVSTFSRAAAFEMKSRFLNLTKRDFPYLTFSTIHSLSYSILRSSPKYKTYSLISEKEKSQIFKEIIEKLYKYYDNNLIKELSSAISYIKNSFFHSDFQENSLERLNIESINFDKLKTAYQVYTDFLNNHLLYDFDDMVPLAISTISSLPSRKKYLICPYDYLLVDEFQDTSLIQLKLLISILNTDNFYAVGDDDQSIYSFRGADPSIITTIKRIFPTLTTYILSENYRSISPIVYLSNKLIRHNSNRYLKEGRATIKTYNKTYIPLVYKEYESHYEEAEEIVKYIKNISKDKNIAILIRTYESGEVIRGLLIRNNINFISSTKSNESIFKFKPVDISITFISFAFKRNRNIKDKSNRYELIKILTTIKSTIPNFAINKDDVLMEDIKAHVGDSMSLKEDYKKLDCILSTIDNLIPEIAFEFIRRACGLDDYFRNEYNKKNIPYENYLDKMEEFKEITKGFSSNEALISFRNRYEDEIEINKKVKDNVKANVIFSTIRYVKGMEFNEVWIPNLNANILPSSKAKRPEEIEEERRLLYVAITRAKEKLILSSHKKEGNKISLPSPFLRELDFSNLRIL